MKTPKMIDRVLALVECNPEKPQQKETVFISIPDEAAFELATLQMFTRRYGGDHLWYDFPEPQPPPGIPISRAMADAMEDGREKVEALLRVEHAAHELSRHVKLHGHWKAIRRCIEEQDQRLAREIFERVMSDLGETWHILWIYDSYRVPSPAVPKRR